MPIFSVIEVVNKSYHKAFVKVIYSQPNSIIACTSSGLKIQTITRPWNFSLISSDHHREIDRSVAASVLVPKVESRRTWQTERGRGEQEDDVLLSRHRILP